MSQIKYKKGNLVDAFINNEVNVLIQQCNNFCTQNSGLAKEIKARLPEMFAADCETIKGDIRKLGSYSCAIFEGDNDSLKYGFNLYGQHRYGMDKQHTDYAAIEKGLCSIRKRLDLVARDDKTDIKIGLAKLGCGLGGGSWDIVSKIIEEQLCNYGYEVICYEL